MLAGCLVATGLVATPGTAQQYPVPPPPAPPPPAPPATALPLISPFPLVRVVGSLTRRGAHISSLTVKTPTATTIVSTCRGKRNRCPYKTRLRAVTGAPGVVRTVHVRRFERSFRAGVVLRLFVVRAGHTGKYTRFAIRRGKQPRRRDRCVAGVVLEPVFCPS